MDLISISLHIQIEPRMQRNVLLQIVPQIKFWINSTRFQEQKDGFKITISFFPVSEL